MHARARTYAHTRTPYWSVSWALKRFRFTLSLFSKANQSFYWQSRYTPLFAGCFVVYVLFLF